MSRMDLFQMADCLRELKDWKKQLDEERKEVSGKIEVIEESLSQAMIEEEMQSFNRGGMMYYLNTKLYASAVPQRKEAMGI